MSWSGVKAWREIMRAQLDALPPCWQHHNTLKAAVETALDALSDEVLSELQTRDVTAYDSAALVLARTVPTATIEWCALFLGWGSRVILKPPSETPHLADWLSTTAQEAGLPLSTSNERAVLNQVDCVVAMGNDASIQAIGQPLPDDTSYTGLGERFSVAWVDAHEQWIHVAQDIALHDTRGCMSPTAIYTELPLHEACRKLHQALESVAEALPRGRVLPYESAAIRARRQMAQATTGVACVGAHGEVHGLKTLRGLPLSLPRCPAVYQVAAPTVMVECVTPFADQLSTVGAPPSTHAAFRLAFPTARICALGHMQRPPVLRLHDGLDWIRRTHR